MTKRKSYKVPFDQNGNLLHIPEQNQNVVWRENVPFTGVVFEIKGHVYGRTALRFLWRDSKTKQTYPMFAVDMITLIKSNYSLINGRTPEYAYWKIVKRGTHYGLMVISDVG